MSLTTGVSNLLKHIVVGSFALLLLAGCIDEYNYPYEEKTNYLVVEGAITTEKGPYEIKLTTTRNVRSEKNAFKLREQNAKVTITTSLGAIEKLLEMDTSGTYYTSPDFRGVVGEKYLLRILLESGKEYLSDSVELVGLPAIDSIGIRYGVERYVSEQNSSLEREGFFTTAYVNDPSEIDNYYLVQWSYTYLIQTIGGAPNTCWVTVSPPEFGIVSDQIVSKNSTEEYPLFFLPTVGVMFAEKVQLKVTFASQSPSAFHFWKEIYNARFKQGGVFDPPPTFIASNIINIQDPTEIVLGRFYASDQKTIKRNIYAQDFPGRIDTDTKFMPPCLNYPTEKHAHITDIKPDDWNE